MNNYSNLMELKYGLDAIKHITFDGREYWYARELQSVLGYKEWRKFENIIQRAINDCIIRGVPSEYHFVQSDKMVQLGSGSMRQIVDYEMTKFGCYLVASCGHTVECADARAYFITNTLINEAEDEAMQLCRDQFHQLDVREQCAETDKRFSSAMMSHGVSSSGVARIKSRGDEALFGYPTQTMKNQYGISRNQSLYDVLDPAIASARMLASELTTRDINTQDLNGRQEIEGDHMGNNYDMRDFLIDHGIIPEQTYPVESSKKTEKYINSQEEELANNCQPLFICPISFLN